MDEELKIGLLGKMLLERNALLYMLLVFRLGVTLQPVQRVLGTTLLDTSSFQFQAGKRAVDKSITHLNRRPPLPKTSLAKAWPPLHQFLCGAIWRISFEASRSSIRSRDHGRFRC
jgi:hypothetical protein